MPWLLILLPIILLFISLYIRDNVVRTYILPIAGTSHLASLLLTLWFWHQPLIVNWLNIDALGSWILIIISTLFFLLSFYAKAYLCLHQKNDNRIFIISFLIFLSLASLLAQAQHPGLIWITMEAITLATAPLIYFHHNRRSIEAIWKYLILSSVGITLAMLGTLFLAYSANIENIKGPLFFNTLINNAKLLSKIWLKTGFILSLVGYGTKIGLAPLHTWKPDVYGESPGVVSALLSGCLTTCAFLALLRIFAILVAANEGHFARQLMLSLGLFSMLWAMIFIIKQTDIKRMLAYSSVEHMGIIAVGIGFGGQAIIFALFHMAANALIKSVLFMSASNIIRCFANNKLSYINGAIRRTPISAWLFFIGFLAIAGIPPFTIFISEFNISIIAICKTHIIIWSLFLILLCGIFLAMSSTVIKIIFGKPKVNRVRNNHKDTIALTAPIIVTLFLSVIFGIWLPKSLVKMLQCAACLVDGQI